MEIHNSSLKRQRNKTMVLDFYGACRAAYCWTAASVKTRSHPVDDRKFWPTLDEGPLFSFTHFNIFKLLPQSQNNHNSKLPCLGKRKGECQGWREKGKLLLFLSWIQTKCSLISFYNQDDITLQSRVFVLLVPLRAALPMQTQQSYFKFSNSAFHKTIIYNSKGS